MSADDPFVGEIIAWGGNFAPVGWQFCNGALLPISGNEALFNLIGTTFGGDGQQTFAVPNLQGRVATDAGLGSGTSNRVLGQVEGAENVAVTATQLPAHTHTLQAATTGDAPTPTGRVPAPSRAADLSYGDATAGVVAMAAGAIGQSSGGSQPHDNMQPFLAVNFIISLYGTFPTQG